MSTAADKAKRKLLGIEIPRDELALRMLVASIGAKPPAGMSASAALSDADRLNPGLADNFRRCADAAVLYVFECIQAGTRPS